jgi:hypothetical protein
MTVFKILLRIPWHLLFLAGILVLVGSLALYSASQGSWQPWAGRHAVRAIVGMALVVCIAFIDFSFIKRMSYVFLAAGNIGFAGGYGCRYGTGCFALDHHWRDEFSTIRASQAGGYSSVGSLF